MKKIAVIEDDVAICAMYCLKFEQSGYEVQSAHNGADGLKLVQEFDPDMILLDIRMPVMNGDAMLKQLRSASWGGKARVIVLTNISKDEAPMGLRLLNFDRYIVKAHHTPKQVVEIVEDVLGKEPASI
jgi:two-component system, OmpR family, alkaline phosphatase synthesis response regulator PhoP